MNGVEAAHAVFDAIEVRDYEKFASLFAPGAVTWRNFDHTDLPVTESAALIKAVMDVLKSTRYEERRYLAVSDGAIVQHTARSVTWDGQHVEVYVMARIYLNNDGLISRIEEYVDTAQGAAIQAALRAHGSIA